MRKLILALLKSTVGKAIVELLISHFMVWLESRGYQVWRIERGDKETMKFRLLAKERLMEDLTKIFCHEQLENIGGPIVKEK